jgi:regulator of sigma E protease
VAGRPVGTLLEARGAFVDATRSAHERGEGAEVPITLAMPVSDGATEERTLALTPDEVSALHALGWDAGAVLAPFETATITVQASNPVQAVMMGVRKTHYVMVMTYLTIVRLVQGTVPVEQLQGPVGITHIGSRIADQGFVYLIFFLGLLSANLAVVNFLPVPVVDGGHMVFLAIEGITGKPVSIAVQNIATLIGLGLIGMMFVVVTYNDIVRLFA